MKARRTPWWHYIECSVIAFLFGLNINTWSIQHGSAMVSAPWYLTASMIAVGLVIAWSAWQVHRFATGKITTMAPQRSVNTLIMAKALGLTGSLLAGWYAGAFVIAVQKLDIPYFEDIAWHTGVAVLVCIIDIILGIISEYWCMLPPSEGKEKKA